VCCVIVTVSASRAVPACAAVGGGGRVGESSTVHPRRAGQTVGKACAQHSGVEGARGTPVLSAVFRAVQAVVTCSQTTIIFCVSCMFILKINTLKKISENVLSITV
jgi:hypothetical protein